MSLILDERSLKIVEAILADHLPGQEVWAFGSRVTRNARLYSDLDLAVLGAEPMPLKLRGAIEEAFTESALPFQVDIVDMASAAPGFRRIVERNYVVVQSSGADPNWSRAVSGLATLPAKVKFES